MLVVLRQIVNDGKISVEPELCRVNAKTLLNTIVMKNLNNHFFRIKDTKGATTYLIENLVIRP